MVCPYSFDLAFATSGQFSGPFDSIASSTQRNDTLMGRGVWYTARVLVGDLGELYALALSLAASLIVITRHLQGQFEQ
jgi:hypothetical protein